MPGCAAIGCSNRAQKGFLMKRFPKDSLRRKQWEIKVRREGWTATDTSFLCEVHFEPCMWEKTRVDGTRKLKHDAVPTLFSFSKLKYKRKAPKDRVQTSKTLRSKDEEISASNFQGTEADAIESYLEGTEAAIVSTIEEVVQPLIFTEASNTSALLSKIKEYQKNYEKLLIKYKNSQKCLRNARIKIKKLENVIKNEKEINKDTKLLKSLFEKDQINAMGRNCTKFMKWSNATVQKALKLKFSCGSSGYNQLLRQKLPLPSLRTLRRRLENLKFDVGVLHEVFDFLKIKVENFKSEHEKDCVIIMDEMSIVPSNLYDTCLNKYLGNVTIPGHTGIATHGLVFMLGGISTHWKQTVAFHFSGHSTDGSAYVSLINEIILNAERIGLKIISVTSDMGSSNQSLWKSWSIVGGRHSKIQNSICHPFDSERKIYIFADVPHLFKNIKNMFVANEIIKIPGFLQQKYQLPTDTIKASHVRELIQLQEKFNFRLAPKLTEDDLTPNNFQKMKVSTSTNVISHSVSSALKFLAEEMRRPEFNTTAWFIEMIEKWFCLMTSRHPTLALSKLNPEKFKEALEFLEGFVEVIQYMEVGTRPVWKPSQTGALISTQSVINISKLFFEEKGYKFLLTSRFTQDCLENLFCVVRSKQVVPTAVQFKNNLK